MSNTQRILFYYRPSSDHRRVVFGGRASFRQTDEHGSSLKLYEYLCEVFPQLRGTRITMGGRVTLRLHLTNCRIWVCTMVCTTAWGATAWVQMMTYLGRQIALKIWGGPIGLAGLTVCLLRHARFIPGILPVPACHRQLVPVSRSVGAFVRLRSALERPCQEGVAHGVFDSGAIPLFRTMD